GKHVMTFAQLFPNIAISTKAAIDAAAAEQVAIDALAASGVSGLAIEQGARLVVYPVDTASGVSYRLGYRTIVAASNPVGRWDTIVAADGTNEILMRHNRVAFVGQFSTTIEPRYIGQTP